VVVIENNAWAYSTPVAKQTLLGSFADRALLYGCPGESVDGQDVEAVYLVARRLVERARQGDGPAIIEAVTYRWGGHSMRANLPQYRTEQEERDWMQRDPIGRFETSLLERKQLTPTRLKELREAVEVELDEAVRFGSDSPEPTVEMMEAAVYAPHIEVREPAPPAPAAREIPMAQALNEALHHEMERDSRVFVMGEDVGLIGGIFGVTRGLREVFGDDRLRDTPISEATFLGMGVGAAGRSALRCEVEQHVILRRLGRDTPDP